MTQKLPRLIVITDWSLGAERLLDAISRVVELGPRVAVQHRHPEASTRVYLDQARRLRALCHPAGAPLFLNGRLDLALLLDAHLHLPAHGAHAAEARSLMPKHSWISAAVHDAREAEAARGADLVLVSPIFGAGSKPGDTRTRLGRDGFDALANRAGCPAYALGGITAETMGQLRGTRAHGIASITGVLAAPDPRRSAAMLLEAVEPWPI